MNRNQIGEHELERFLLEMSESSGAGNSVMNELRLAAKEVGNMYVSYRKLIKANGENLDEINNLKNRCTYLESRIEGEKK